MKLGTILFVISAVLGLKKECPGGSFQCPDDATCCQLTDERYGCCPMENAVCCMDRIHCCPVNTKCSASLCIQSTDGNTSVPAYSLKPNDVCPGGKYVCPDSSTCCETRSGDYACCPLASAVCCEDQIHCCPQNSVCDIQAGRCTQKGIVSDLYHSEKNHAYAKNIAKLGSLRYSKNITSVFCPGGQFQCPNGYTCCQLPTGDYGCCPFVNASCCSDHVHCCPEDYKCDVFSESCIHETRNVSASLNVPAVKVQDHECPDKTTCSTFQTCCSTGGGHYGCCGFSHAVCCEDNQHCCPENYSCNLVEKRCEKKKVPSVM